MDDRTLLAAIAMGGIFASGHKDTFETVTYDAVTAADMLVKALRDSGRSLARKWPTGSVNGSGANIYGAAFRRKQARSDSGH